MNIKKPLVKVEKFLTFIVVVLLPIILFGILIIYLSIYTNLFSALCCMERFREEPKILHFN